MFLDHQGKNVEQTIKDLTYHADVLDIMGMGKDSVMVIHGGGVYGKIKNYIKMVYQLS